MNAIRLGYLRKDTDDELRALLAAEDRPESGLARSPDIADALFWNVFINFSVCVAAIGATALAAYAGSRVLTYAERRHAKEIVRTETVPLGDATREEITAALRASLSDGIGAVERDRIADRARTDRSTKLGRIASRSPTTTLKSRGR